MGPNPIKHASDITITGTNLDLVKKLLFTWRKHILLLSLVSQSATQIVVKIPGTTRTGKVILEVLQELL